MLATNLLSDERLARDESTGNRDAAVLDARGQRRVVCAARLRHSVIQ